MKPVTCVLLGSLALNVFIGVAWLRWSRGNETTPRGGSTAESSAPAPAAGAAHLLALEPAALRSELQRLDLPREAVDALVLARIYSRHDARRHELMLETSRLPWWQTVAAGPDRLSLLTADQRKELRHLAAAARSEALALLGPAALDRDGAMAATYPFVPADRAVLLDALIRDYGDMSTMLRETMHGLRTARDRADEDWVESQKQRDLEKILTPAEREILELRTSTAAAHLKARSFTFEPTEAEYRAVFDVYREFHASHPETLNVEGGSRPATLSEYPDYEAKVQAALGEARYADWSLGAQRYTVALTRLAPEYGFTADQVRDSSRLLRDTATRSWSIGEDPSATLEQKHAALIALVAETRRTLTAQLGATGTAALAAQTEWLNTIASGNAVRVGGSGMQMIPVSGIHPSSVPLGNAPPGR